MNVVRVGAAADSQANIGDLTAEMETREASAEKGNRKMEPVAMTIHVTNERSTPMTFWLEPYGQDHLVDPGAVFQVVVHGPAGGDVEIFYGDESLTIAAWGASVVCEGITLGSKARICGPGMDETTQG
jgi:hypothetical protein